MSSRSVLQQVDLLWKVLGYLTKLEAAGLYLASKSISAVTKDLIGKGACRSRVVLVSSKNNMLVELDPCTGDIIKAVQASEPHRGSWRNVRGSFQTDWLTGVAFSPHDGDLYVSNYELSGIVRYDGRTLMYKQVFCCSPKLQSPEGVVFSNGAVFVASAHNCTIVKISLKGKVQLPVIDLRKPRSSNYDGRKPPNWVPWGLATGPVQPAGHLLVAVDTGFQAKHYADAPNTGEGSILEIMYDQIKRVYDVQWSLFPSGTSRPSGLCVDLQACSSREGDSNDDTRLESYLYVTSSHAPLLRTEPDHRKPLSARKLLPLPAHIPADTSLGPCDKQWDVCVVKDSIFVTVHTGHADHCSRIHQYRKWDGKLIRVIRSQYLIEPNMMAVQR